MTTATAPAFRRPLDLDPGRLALVVGAWPEPAILGGGPGLGPDGRWSFLAAHPRLVFEATGLDWTLRSSESTERGSGDILEPLAGLIRRLGLADPAEEPDPALPPFRGGLVGFFGYDLAPQLERLPRKAAADSRLPDIRFALYDTVIAVDHANRSAELWAVDLLDEGPEAVARRGRRWLADLQRPPSTPPRSRLGPIRSRFTRESYLGAVRRALDYIEAGDIFQVNLSQRFEAEGRPEPLDLYLRLRAESPAPFGSFLRWDDAAVISASPEWFVQTRGDRVVTRPIKGTRPRGSDPEEDARLIAELKASPKDRAELTMIVDLERNDLGRACRYGSVRVASALEVETFAQVHHLVATVEGRLRPEVGPIDLLRSVFPGGSITGAPKIRAMEIIDELEPNRRSLYTGAIGYFGVGGTSAFNIAIRTLLVEGDRVSYQVGGGIVADSDPEAEYLETLHKGRALRAVLEASS